MIAPNDYTEVTGSVTLSETTPTDCISVTITSDSVVEGVECFIVSFSSNNIQFTLKAPSVATVCIQDGKLL